MDPTETSLKMINAGVNLFTLPIGCPGRSAFFTLPYFMQSETETRIKRKFLQNVRLAKYLTDIWNHTEIDHFGINNEIGDQMTEIMANMSKEMGGDFSKVNRLLDEARLMIEPKLNKSHGKLIKIMIIIFVVFILISMIGLIIYCKCKRVIKRYHVIKSNNRLARFKFIRACCKIVNQETKESDCEMYAGIDFIEEKPLDTESAKPNEANKRPAPPPVTDIVVKKQRLDKHRK